jgi:porphobilinogen deaminase
VFVLKKDGNVEFTNETEFLKKVNEDKSREWTIGTSSLRRIAQLRHLSPNVKVEDIRGNIDTRLKKLDDPKSDYAALVLAAAGLKRAGYGERINVSLRNDWWHAVGQGAIALECRENDEFIHNLLYPLVHFKTTYEIIAERSFMQYLEGGCSVPLGVKCWFGSDDRQVTLYSDPTPKQIEADESSKQTSLPTLTVDGDSCPARNAKRTSDGEPKKSSDSSADPAETVRKDCDGWKSNTNESSTEVVLRKDSGRKSAICPVLSAKRVMQHLLENNQLVAQQEYKSSDQFDCNNISNLCLSGVVYSPDGERRVQFNANLEEAVSHFENEKPEDQPKVNCSHVSLPTRACPKLQQVRVDYEKCAKLGVYVARKMVEMGAQDILEELRQVRRPIVDESEEGSN